MNLAVLILACAPSQCQVVHYPDWYIHTVEYAPIEVNGHPVNAPVYNGYLPRVQVCNTYAGTTMHFWYYQHPRYVYQGQSLIRYQSEALDVVSKPQPRVKAPPQPIRKQRPKIKVPETKPEVEAPPQETIPRKTSPVPKTIKPIDGELFEDKPSTGPRLRPDNNLYLDAPPE